MKADHRNSTVWIEQGNGSGQDQREFRELAVDENPKSLERARGRILTPITPRARADGFGHDPRKLTRAVDGPLRASRNNCSCNRLSKPFFTMIADHLCKFARGCPRQECRSGLAATGVHSHVERTLGAKREATSRIVDLRRGDAKIKENAVGTGDAKLREDVGQLRKPATAKRESRIDDDLRSRLGGRIPIECDEPPARPETTENCS